MPRAKKPRTAAQKRATAIMRAARGAGKKRRTPPQPPAQGKPMARRRRRRTTRRSRRPAGAGATRRRRTTRRSRRPSGAGRRGSTMLAPIVGTVIGAGAALGLGGLTSMALAAIRGDKPATETEKTVAEYAPLVGAGVIAALGFLVPKYKAMTMSAVIGAALVFALGKYQASKAKPAGYYNAARGYNRLRGAGNVARVLNAPAGAGNVARVLNS